MPRLSIKTSDGWVTVGPLAAITDFQVRDGAVLITGEAPSDTDWGFDRRAGDTVQFGVGKTVSIRTNNAALVHYEALE